MHFHLSISSVFPTSEDVAVNDAGAQPTKDNTIADRYAAAFVCRRPNYMPARKTP